MSNVTELHCITTVPLSPDKVLSEAVGNLECCLVLGRTKDGKFYAASSESDLQFGVFLANQFVQKVFSEYLPHEDQ